MERPTPINQQSPFNIEELFFSKTDPRGNIEDGNRVFIRVSGYPREQMLGAPHNLIRHPDMPRSVFKLFWDTIQKGQPIGAYVKNMAANGAYYWVFACAFPVEGGYLSIRLKPSTPFLDLMPGIYSEILELESKSGMDAGIARILEILKGKGFDSYLAFMTEALSQELRVRDQAVIGNGGNGGNGGKASQAKASAGEAGHGAAETLQKLALRSQDAARAYASILDRLDRFTKGSRTFQEQTEIILRAYRELGLLSFNMAIAAESAGEQGKTLSVVASTFQRMASEIQAQLTSFQSSMQRLTKTIQDSQFKISAACLQTEMTRFFVNELVEQQVAGEEAPEGSDTRGSCRQLLTLAANYSLEARQGVQQLQALLRQFTAEREELEASVVGLEVIRQSGTIESSRSVGLKNAFEAHIERMRVFVASVKEPTRNVGDTMARLLVDSQDTLALISRVLETFRQANQVLS